MLRKGSIKVQITTGTQTSEMVRVNGNRRVLEKFMSISCTEKMVCKKQFYDLIEHIRNLGDKDLIRHFQTMKNNATYLLLIIWLWLCKK